MFLHPWIGKDYKEGINNEKILILGESHYSSSFNNNQEFSNFTAEVVEDIVSNKIPIKFMQNVGYLFNDDWSVVWDKIAFANLIQFVFDNPTETPNKEQIATVVTFYKYLEILKPDKVIVCSNRAWWLWFEKHIDITEGVQLIKEAQLGLSYIIKYPHSTGKSLTIGINHPSDRNTPSKESYRTKWKPVIDTFLDYSFTIEK